MTAWRAQGLQFVWFLTSADQVDGEALFKAIVGSEPDSVQKNKIPSPANPFLSVCYSETEDRTIVTQVQPGRVDFLFNARAQENGVPLPGSSFDLDVANDLLNSMKAADKMLGPAVRVSVVATTAYPADDYESAARAIADVTGFDPGLDGVSDISVQLNRRTYSKAVDGLAINRVVRYHVAAAQTINFEVGSGGVQPMAISSVILSAVQTLDFNTVPDGRLFASSERMSIFAEIVSEIARVASSGTIQSLGQEL
ncbi:hypothetical protein [Tianweitania sediminis]|uniref:Uncharacterized protein n=1 Tax=Tianweitania sediminis TaxID=1502156 RepID=A0A8J7RLU5_9HYPH|nr:hypothetical protein [Tianweitania sediminis]MBP0439551.1 hypothetical protein [Tianweitania sediminis]